MFTIFIILICKRYFIHLRHFKVYVYVLDKDILSDIMKKKQLLHHLLVTSEVKYRNTIIKLS